MKSFLKSVSACIHLSWKASKLYTIARLFLNLCTPLLSFFQVLIGKYIINILAGAIDIEEPAHILLVFMTLLLFCKIFRTLIQKAQYYMQSMHDDTINRDISLAVMDKVGKADIEHFDNAEYYDKITSFSRDASIVTYLLWNILSAISSIFTVIVSFLALCKLNSYYGIITISASIPSAIVSAKYSKALYSLSLEQINGERQKNYLYNLLIDKRFAMDLRLFDVCETVKNKYKKIWSAIFNKKKTINKRQTILTGALESLPELVVALIGIIIAFQTLSGEITVGDYSLYVGLLSQLWSAVYILTNSLKEIYDNQLKIKNLKTLDTFDNHILDKGEKTLTRIDTISFEHVSFCYPNTCKEILHDVSFSICAGEKIALVGINGSGKSSIIKLLLRMYDINCGSILINGIDIREYRLSDLRKNFSVYFQDDPSYSFSLRENITISDIGKDNDDSGVIKAIIQGGAEDILDNAPSGLDTYITRMFDNSGIELSGGQYQKLALARVFYRRYSTLVLDEPSSFLDPEAEHMLFERIKNLTNGQTVLFTSHRLINTFLADRIIVIENGRIIETGTHNELLANEGRYAELFRYQAERYKPKK